MYTVIFRPRNINIESSSLLLDTTSTEKRPYQNNKFYLMVTHTSTIYPEVYIYI